MRTFAKTFAAVSVAALLAGVSVAKAQTPEQMPEPQNAGIGVGVICDTSEQAGQFVNLRGEGLEPKQAMQRINAEARQPGACGLAAIAFTRDQTIDMRAMGNQFVQIVRITVVAGYNGSGWQRVAGPVTQYAVMEGEGEST